jgi:hypothetical protein
VLLLLCHQVHGNDFLTNATVQDAWTPIVTTNTITRLHRVTQQPHQQQLDEDIVTAASDDDATTPQLDNDVVCSGDTSNSENYLIETFNGDIVVTIILHQSDNARAAVKFIVGQINEIGVLAHNITIGEFITLQFC